MVDRGGFWRRDGSTSIHDGSVADLTSQIFSLILYFAGVARVDGETLHILWAAAHYDCTLVSPLALRESDLIEQAEPSQSALAIQRIPY